MSKSIVWPAALALLVAGIARGQGLACRGVGGSGPPDSVMISIDLAKTEGGEWKAPHGRIGDQGSDHATSVLVKDGVLTAVFEQLKATYVGPVASGGGVISGAWTKDGRRMPFNVGCRVTAPVPDASPHTVRFIAVQKDVQLEVLDWGGSGRPVVLLHGLAATAHDFDAFAPTLTADYHVYALTRRGFGRSSVPDGGYSSDRFGDDVVAILDSLHLDRPVLVGHSLGGVELSSVGSRFPQRIAGLIYLDAAYPYAYVDTTRMRAMEPIPELMPKCPCSVTEKLELGGGTQYRHIPVPVLAIYAMKPDWDTRNYDDRAPDWTPAAQAREFERGVPTARVVRIPNANHYVFRSNEAQVLSEMRAFISRLPAAKP
ncbi:MAG: alpha/beta fold hydrolase [bacterium]